jgi:hypothetical protein
MTRTPGSDSQRIGQRPLCEGVQDSWRFDRQTQTGEPDCRVVGPRSGGRCGGLSGNMLALYRAALAARACSSLTSWLPDDQRAHHRMCSDPRANIDTKMHKFSSRSI